MKQKTSFWHSVVLMIHPENVRVSSILFRRTFGLGGMAMLLFALQAITGILLRFVYEPTPVGAYDSILFIKAEVVFGNFVRNIHHWSGMLIVVIVFLHLLRVFYTQAYYPPRRFNWIIGIFLLALTILLNFTGYLLPWDQLSYWAVTVSTNMLEYVPLAGEWLKTAIRGGEQVSGPTLLIFYNLHTGVLPLILMALLVFHFWKIRKAGGVIVPQEKDDKKNKMVSSIPNLLDREVAVGLALMAFILLLSVFVNAPLLERADPSFSPNPVKSPWYFSGVQELLLHFHPTVAVFVIPLLAVVWLLSFPYMKPEKRSPGMWFYTAKGLKMVYLAAATSLVLTIGGILAGEYLIDFQAWLPSWPELISNGLIPLLIWTLFLTGMGYFVKRKYRAGRTEMQLWIFTYLLVAYLVLMFTGILFRGAAMSLVWAF
ncbi:MAG: cytochrome bc complex cytochrome b subunit [Bacteroidetes bacterium]|nr:MAG: cytochrome bc complex cytochrome b subunit [Bacteroidota bacterium]RLD76712.1 MAG: cytochrome bc complex cytochrome b subunit [Bacteroidota bacterium]